MARNKLPPQVMEERIQIGLRLKAERERIGFSQTELADEAEITVSSLEKYETGERALPVEVLLKLCRVFADRHQSIVHDWIIGRMHKANHSVAA